MAVDPRQVLAGFLTISMFTMLGNMVKKDHFDTVEIKLQEVKNMQFDALQIEEKAIPQVSSKANNEPWKEGDQELKPCWTKSDSEMPEQTKGFITFSLTGSPEYHVSEVADAVMVAKHLGATLVLPDIRGSELGQRKTFSDMYNADKFIESMNGVIKIAKELPAELAGTKPAVVRVPNPVTEYFMMRNIEPIYRTTKFLRVASIFSSTDLKVTTKHNGDLDSTACLAMFGSLTLKQEISEVTNWMVERLRTLSRDTDSKFIAVDLRTDMLQKKSCKESTGTEIRPCYNAQEIADFLRKVGFKGDETIYVTETWWDESLNPLKQVFRKTYTKDDLIPADKKSLFLSQGNAELERALDLDICSSSDIFVPAISGLFYGNVAGKRIINGRTQILVPGRVLSPSANVSDFLSDYVTKKNHLAYSCFC